MTRRAGRSALVAIVLGFLVGPASALVGFPGIAGAHHAPGSTGTTSGAPALVDSWPVYLHDVTRSGNNPNSSLMTAASAAHLRPAWTLRTNASVVAQPAVVNGTVYVGSWDGIEYALDAASGHVAWSRNLSTVANPLCPGPTLGITSSASVVDGVLYVGSGAGWWYALDAQSGAVLWRIPLGNTSAYYNWAGPLIHGGYAYIGLASACEHPRVRGALLMVSLASHAVVRTFYTVGPGQLGGSVWGSPTYDPTSNSVYFATGNWVSPSEKMAEAIIKVNASTLRLEGRWQVPPTQVGVDADFGTTPTLFLGANGTPLVGAVNKNGIFYALDRSNLSLGPVWSFPIAVGGACPACGQGSIAPAATDGSRLYIAGGRTTVGTVRYNGSVAALDPSTGSSIWHRGLSAPVLGAVTVAGGLLFVTTGAHLEVLNASTGAIRTILPTGGAIWGAASVVGSCAFVGANDGKVYAFGPHGGACRLSPNAVAVGCGDGLGPCSAPGPPAAPASGTPVASTAPSAQGPKSRPPRSAPSAGAPGSRSAPR